MPEPRILDFHSLDHVMPEVQRLLAGHATVGNWSLGQILDHLATAIRMTSGGRSESTPRAGSDVFRKRFFKTRRFPAGAQAPHPRLIPAPDSDAQEQAALLGKAIARWSSTEGPFADHPLLGTLTKDEWTQFHCIHCAHHLGFVIPAEGVD
jgi:hypothetical protein